MKDVIAANPGISMPEAVARLNAYNSAIARGEVPPPLSASAAALHSLALQSVGALPVGMPLLANPLLVNPGHMNPLLGAPGDAATKPHREIYVGNLPSGISVPQLAEFMNAALKHVGIASDLQSVVTAWVSPDGHYGFVELRSVEMATSALQQLNGIQVGMNTLKVGRPKGYNPAAASAVGVPMTSLAAPLAPLLAPPLSLNAPTNPLLSSLNLGGDASSASRVIMVTNLPSLITEAQIKDLFSSFGDFKAFNVIPVTGGNQSAVFEYVDSVTSDVIDSVIQGMNGIDLGGTKISVARIPASSAAILLKPTQAQQQAAAQAASAPAATTSTTSNATSEEDRTLSLLRRFNEQLATSVVRLSNMTTDEDLVDEQAYDELIEDVASECQKYGTVLKVHVPRDRASPAYGVVFVHFTDAAGAAQAKDKIQGRKFNGKVVQAVCFPEKLFVDGEYTLSVDFDPVAYAQQSKATNGHSASASAPTRPVTAADELD